MKLEQKTIFNYMYIENSQEQRSPKRRVQAHKLIPISAPANFSLSPRSPHDEQPREVNRTEKSPTRWRIVRDEKINAPKGGDSIYLRNYVKGENSYLPSPTKPVKTPRHKGPFVEKNKLIKFRSKGRFNINNLDSKREQEN